MKTHPYIHTVIPRAGARDFSKTIHALSQKLVFTNGCFDIIHLGHIKYLEEAKSLGDLLVVGVNSDRSARALKGPKRPLVGQHDRAKIVASLYCVDHSIIFDEDTPVELISELRPDIHVKGGDYNAEDLAEYKILRSYGAEVRILAYIEGKSSTNIIEQIKNAYNSNNKKKSHGKS